ncbi:MAG: helix-turn-helix transcriptional regulator [Campylobacterales bacterium]|nr:helix-turn-helix transcriptional regulator [Campylobacterales bacterium]
MEVYEKVNEIIKNYNLTKRAFSTALRNLNVKLKTTGEMPSENTIYAYLSGKISIPIELIPFIAEVLNVTEQELFDNTSKSRTRCFKYFIKNSNHKELEYFNNFIKSQITYNINVNNADTITTNSNDNKVDKFISLLEFAPHNFLDKAIAKLEEYKNIDSTF